MLVQTLSWTEPNEAEETISIDRLGLFGRKSKLSFSIPDTRIATIDGYETKNIGFKTKTGYQPYPLCQWSGC